VYGPDWPFSDQAAKSRDRGFFDDDEARSTRRAGALRSNPTGSYLVKARSGTDRSVHVGGRSFWRNQAQRGHFDGNRRIELAGDEGSWAPDSAVYFRKKQGTLKAYLVNEQRDLTIANSAGGFAPIEDGRVLVSQLHGSDGPGLYLLK
jgi:hypothetical protein